VIAFFAAVALWPAASAAPATPVGLGLREYHISVYRPTVHAGRVAFNMTNFGEDKHDLQVVGPGGYRSAVSHDVDPFGGRLRFTVNLRRAGTYRLLCVKPGHVALGMKATLRVVHRRPS
jgi:plastocyanin